MKEELYREKTTRKKNYIEKKIYRKRTTQGKTI